MIRALLTSLVAATTLAGCVTEEYSRQAAQVFAPAAPPANPGAVSAADPRAEEAGLEILHAGGSATDAAIAVMLAINVVEPQSSGIGGGGFFVRGTADGAVQTIDGRETAPDGATQDWFLDAKGNPLGRQQATLSGLSVGVPGNIALAAKAHAEYGKAEWAQLFEPAIRLARSGFTINTRLHNSLTRNQGRANLSAFGSELFYDDAGKPHPVGTLIVNPLLADTLERIAKHGPQAFYHGEAGEALAQTVAAATPRDGAMTAADLASYLAKDRPAVCGTYRGYRICSMSAPSSGGVAIIQILGQLERFDLAALGLENPVTWHLFLESQRLAYADRELYLADSDFVAVPIAGLTNREYLDRRSALIDPSRALTRIAPGVPPGAQQLFGDGDEPPEQGTTHFSVVDNAQNMVSYTSTIEGPFGSGLTFGGFYLNNELTDFSRSPMMDGKPVANRVEGGKRPRSSMAPTIVWDPQGKPFMMVGAAGGPTIPVQAARSIIGAIDFGLSAEEALAMPFLMAFSRGTLVEQGTWLEAAIPAFSALGHRQIFAQQAPVKGGAIVRRPGGWESARDPRLEGELGYLE